MKTEIKDLLKKIPCFTFLNKLRKNLKIKREFLNDYKIFKENYIGSNKSLKNIEYELLLNVHSLEKGMSNYHLQPFGYQKIKSIIELLKKYEKKAINQSFAYNISLNCLIGYKKLYEKQNWVKRKEYYEVSSFLDSYKGIIPITTGTFELKSKDIKDKYSIDYDKFLKSRHSVRNFDAKPLSMNDVKKAIKTAINSPSACNRQMWKVYYITNSQNKEIIKNYAQGLSGFDLTNANYFIITFDLSANYFFGDRNQGWFNAGLFSMNFVNALHSLGIGSCFIQFGNSFKEEKELKECLDIPTSERIAVIIVAGYYATISKIPYSTRKNIADILSIK